VTNPPLSDIPEQKPAVATVVRPWGFFKQYAHNSNVTVSMMFVKPGERLSLQSHTRRAELWLVIDDGAVIQIGDSEFTGKAGEEYWIPAQTPHRLSNPAGPGEVRVLEVAFGDWQQDDITRYMDDYARPQQGE